ncbi:MAG TPA: alpha/beta fold hydrolase [Candidatus Polarisedimenticolaceae bacterium]|nr:alpha/beta fold hydrolase [Candidatus Polarisedimenticolaceae bacterium]
MPPIASEPWWVPVEPGTEVGLLVSRPAAARRGTVLLLHGMGGSAESCYLRHTAAAALSRGFAAVRMNHRNCGGTEAHCRTLANGGQSEDVGQVLRALDGAGFPRPLVAVGYSLGGNVVLRWAGMRGEGAIADRVAGMNAPVDLARCSAALERPSNWAYQAFFVSMLCRHLRRVRRLRRVPGPAAVPALIRTVRRFDGFFTAPDAGLPSAEAYYAWGSAGAHLPGVRVPGLVLSTANDPFVPPSVFTPHRAAASPSLRWLHPTRGGHLGDRRAMTAALMDWLE